MQVLGKIYAILSDANKRAIYDEDGTVDEEDDTTFNQVWNEIVCVWACSIYSIYHTF